MCLAANIPLIESGTTGFNGQVQVIEKVGDAIQAAKQGANKSRERLSAMIATQSQLLHRIPCARFEPHRHNPFIA